MTSRSKKLGMSVGARAIAIVGGLAAALAPSSCGKKEEPPPAPPPVVTRTRAPEPVNVASFATDPRVQFPQSAAPTDESLARAVAGFASAIASGDSDAVGGRLDPTGRGALGMLVDSGDWKSATASLKAVRIVRVQEEGGSARVGLALEDGAGAYLTAWRADSSGGGWTFAAIPIDPRVASRASDLDGADLSEAAVEAPKPVAAEKDKAKPKEEEKEEIRDLSEGGGPGVG